MKAGAPYGERCSALSVANTWTSKIAKIMDPILPASDMCPVTRAARTHEMALAAKRGASEQAASEEEKGCDRSSIAIASGLHRRAPQPLERPSCLRGYRACMVAEPSEGGRDLKSIQGKF